MTLACVAAGLVRRALASGEELLMIIEVTRHGARAPLKKWYARTWGHSLQLGELSDVGKRQHYLLGRELASRYPSFFGSKLRAEEFYVRSTAISRTQASAVSHLMGMWDHFSSTKLPFPNGDRRIQPAGQPITPDKNPFDTPLPFGLLVSPIHSESLEEDFLLRPFSETTCPKKYTEIKQSFETIAQQLETDQDFKRLVKEATDRYGHAWDGTDALKTCYDVADFALQDAANSPSPTIAASDPLLSKIARCYHFGIGGVNEADEYRRTLNAPIVLEIIGKLNAKVQTVDSKLKYMYYSSHDVNIAGLQSLFGLLDFRCIREDLLAKSSGDKCGTFPELASNVLIELSTERDIDYVKLKLNFEPIDFCNERNADQQFRCRLSDFTYKLLQMVDSSWQDFCGYQSKSVPAIPTRPTTPVSSQKALLRFFALLVVIINLIVLFACARLTSKKLSSTTRSSEAASNLTEDKL